MSCKIRVRVSAETVDFALGESCRYKVIYVYRITRTESHKEFLKIGDTTLAAYPEAPASAAFAGLQVKINAGAPGFPQPSSAEAT